MKKTITIIITTIILLSAISLVVYAQNPFVDVAKGSWYEKAVDFCYEKGYVSGTSATQFSPNAKVTRAMFSLILCKVANADLSTYTRSSFDDIPVGKWYSSAVEWIYLNNIATGATESTFAPNSSVTREQICIFLKNYSELCGIDTSDRADLSTYSDEKNIHSWAYDAVSWANACGYINGSSNKIMPRDSATRAQIVVIIKNYIESVGKIQ